MIQLFRHIVYLCRSRYARRQLVLCRIYFQYGEDTCRLSFFQETWNFRKLLSPANTQTMCCRRTTQHLSWLPTEYPVHCAAK